MLEQMARDENQNVPQFINVLYSEILNAHKTVNNFTSFLRVACALYLHRKETGTGEGKQGGPDISNALM